ncbi:MAG: DEAD/DEAH box helicase family protein [Anaerolineae bacterium]|nr:DEAD/DEAH box helicase family protein [Anaerolineae bacterium]
MHANLRDITYRVFYRPNDNPLETFYLPTLAAAVHYDRSAGYFRSSALAAAAAGIARLIHNNGAMRLLVGAELSEPDVEAIKTGYDQREAIARAMLAQLPDAETLRLDGPLKQRLDALTWMVANGTLDIKVVLPLDAQGFPIPGNQAHEYYHTKKGVFTDAAGNQVGFVGSVNESAQAWKRNFEEFSVYCSWEGERDRSALGQLRASFNELWEGRDPHWAAIDLPEAVREELLKRAPSAPPALDPLERPRRTVELADDEAGFAVATPEERLLFQFLRDAPTLLNAQDLGAATSAITPWPHQLQVARTLVERFPARALLCDEVGLGKTIEAGLVIRQLILSGRVKRCLILAPAAVLKQWQEELYEKFNLDIPRYHGGQLYDVTGEPIGPPTDNPWDECNLLLASTHLAKRQERARQLANAQPWDLMIVDEAHHARRKDFLQQRYRPNRLLTLLNKLKENEQYQGLLLLTATPMQVHPVEVWDLLTVLGLGGRWGADENNFLGFFGELRRPFQDTEWGFVFDLVADHLENSGGNGQIDPHFYETMQRNIGMPRANAIRDLPYQRGQRQTIVRSLPELAQPYVREMARRHTPLQHTVFRSTRDLLRQYVAKGYLQANVPHREPTIQRVTFLPEEAELYLRITEYISEFYARYENERRGLGFIMTVYRRRLTSSFYAVRKSLERRRDWLTGQLEFGEAFTQEDEADLDELDELEQAGFDLHGLDPQRPLTPGQKEHFLAELDYLDSFITDLQALSQGDSKVNQLKDELNRIFRQRPTVIIFTQYTDTMDYLREQLQTVYRGQIACYSGRGGEIWQGMTWLPTSKEVVKNKFRDGDIKILLATESASEGLNLQTCGVLLNYDMPWNPMRVEQRIGRIDRIGQTYDTVWIYNYFYRDTIEDRIYQALKDRINWFEDVVGSLQPILTDVNKITRDLAMLPAERQAAEFELVMRQLRQEIDQAKVESLNLDDFLQQDEPTQALQSPVTLADLEAMLTKSLITRHLFRPHPDIEAAYWLRWNDGETAVTFRAERFDQFPDTLQLLSYGNRLLTEILHSVPAPDYEEPDVKELVRFEHKELLPVIGWYSLAGSSPVPIETFAQLEKLIKKPPQADSVYAARFEAADKLFSAEAALMTRTYQQRLLQFGQQRQAVLQAKASRIVEQAALIEIALGQQRSLFESESYPTGFNQEAVKGLARHGGVWKWLLVAATNKGKLPLPYPDANDLFYEQLKGEKPEKLKTRFKQITEDAGEVVQSWKEVTKN